MGKRSAVQVSQSFWEVVTSPQARKLQVAVVGIILSAVTMGLFPPAIAVWITLIVNGLVAAGVFAVPNAPAPVSSVLARGDVEVIDSTDTVG